MSEVAVFETAIWLNRCRLYENIMIEEEE